MTWKKLICKVCKKEFNKDSEEAKIHFMLGGCPKTKKPNPKDIKLEY